MFSGIVDHCGTIIDLQQRAEALHILIHSNFKDLILGESIAVDGICLTVTESQQNQFYCDISSETLRLTTAQEFTKGRVVNLERALRMGDRIGGHWVNGHVDQRGRVQAINTQQDFMVLTINEIDPAAMSFLIKKGSITINGVSLTVNEVLTDGFQVMLIPHTLQRTNLHLLTVGQTVNLEFDWMARVVVQQFKQLEISKK